MVGLSTAAGRFQRALTGSAPADAEIVDLVRLARALPPLATFTPAPEPEFVDRLGVRLREAAVARAGDLAARPVSPARPDDVATAPGGASPTPHTPRRPDRPRVVRLSGAFARRSLGAVAAAAVVLAGVGAASRSALPGDLLYPVKGALDSAAVSLASQGYQRGQTRLAQAQMHIGELRALLTDDPVDPADVAVAVDAVTDSVTAATAQFALDAARTHSDRSRLALPDFAARALPQLDALRSAIPEAVRPAFDELVALLTGLSVPPGAGQVPTLPTGGIAPRPTAPAAPTGLPTGLPTGTVATPPAPAGGSATPVTAPGGTSSNRPATSTTSPLVTLTVPVPTLPLPSVTVPTVPLPTLTATVPLTTVTATVPLPTISVGDTVRILGGSLAGLTGKVVAVDEQHGTVTVAVTVLGLTNRVTLPLSGVALL